MIAGKPDFSYCTIGELKDNRRIVLFSCGEHEPYGITNRAFVDKCLED